MYRVRQRFDDTRVNNIAETVKSEMNKLSFQTVKPAQRIAITAGSRGVANIAEILRAIVDFCQCMGAEPFIFPAMGSHGGATSEGQLAVLRQLGVTESYVKAPVLSSMETKEIGKTEDGIPVLIDKHAYSADHIIVVNRVKSHTKFKAPIESGLMKMMAIGMGKHKGAELYHKAAIQYTFPRIIIGAGREVITRAPVLCGLGIVENGSGETAKIAALKPEEIESKETELLLLAKKMMAQLPFNEIDLLIVDEMGKDISGVGIDPNVTGRNRDILAGFPHPAHIKRLFVRDLTEKSKGNATGIGLADITTKRLVDKINRSATYINCITGISLEKAAIPMYVENDREAIEIALGSIGLTSPEKSKIIRIKNTLQLEIVEISEAYAEAFNQRTDLKILDGPCSMVFDSNNNLLALCR
jgi:hypothetical protein